MMARGGRVVAVLIAVLILSSLHAVAPVFATLEPKAEPLLVEFKPNAASVTLKGMVQGRQEAEYLFAARKGQKLSIRVASNPRGSVVPRITDPDSRGLQLRRGGSSTWTATLPKSG